MVKLRFKEGVLGLVLVRFRGSWLESISGKQETARSCWGTPWDITQLRLEECKATKRIMEMRTVAILGTGKYSMPTRKQTSCWN